MDIPANEKTVLSVAHDRIQDAISKKRDLTTMLAYYERTLSDPNYHGYCYEFRLFIVALLKTVYIKK